MSEIPIVQRAGKILTAEDFRQSPERIVREHWPFWLSEYRKPEGIAAAPTVAVEVNHGRWIIHCPFSVYGDKCRGAQLASRHDHRFFCVECLQPGIGLKWLSVVWPEEVAAIERALLMRPNMKNRNWLPTEVPMALRAENAAFVSEELLEKVWD